MCSDATMHCNGPQTLLLVVHMPPTIIGYGDTVLLADDEVGGRLAWEEEMTRREKGTGEKGDGEGRESLLCKHRHTTRLMRTPY